MVVLTLSITFVVLRTVAFAKFGILLKVKGTRDQQLTNIYITKLSTSAGSIKHDVVEPRTSLGTPR